MTEEAPKIVSLHTRLPYQAPVKNEPPEPGEPHMPTLDTANELMEGIETGDLQGVIILAWSPKERRFTRWVTLPPSDNDDASNAALHFLGGLRMMEEGLMDIACIEGDYMGPVMSGSPGGDLVEDFDPGDDQ